MKWQQLYYPTTIIQSTVNILHCQCICGLFYRAKINPVTYHIALIWIVIHQSFLRLAMELQRGDTPVPWEELQHGGAQPWACDTVSPTPAWHLLTRDGLQNWHCEWRWAQLYLAGAALPPAPALVPSLPERWDSIRYTMYPTPSLSPSGSNFRLRLGHQKLSGDQGPRFSHTRGCTVYNAESKGLIESLWSLP